MKKEFKFYIGTSNEIHYSEAHLPQYQYIATMDCDEHDAELLLQAMQLAVNAKVEMDKKKSNPPGKYSIIKN